MNNNTLRAITILSVAFLVFALFFQFSPWIERLLISATTEPRVITARGDLAASEQATIGIFEQSSPSVVYITTLQRLINPWTRDIRSVPQGTGSGFIWDDLGHVVTNHHVIAEASEAKVRLNDGRNYRATLVGSSPAHDLAVLRIRVPFDRPPPVPVGSSKDLKVGQSVYAIGNPFGLDQTLTTGVVSALDRSLTAEDESIIDHLIQTDAAINPGNSGGPLLDSAGRLIGINTAIYSPSGAYAGIGFAVPVDTVNRVVPELIAKGRYTRPQLGVEINDEISRAVLKRLDIDGVLILKVGAGSLAESIGLRGTQVDADGEIVLGDVLQKVDGTPVNSINDLLSRLDDFQRGEQITITIWRDGNTQQFEVVL